MGMPTIHKPKTVGELRAVLAELPDDMPLYHRNAGDWLSTLFVSVGKAGKNKPKRVVYRGGDDALILE